MGVRIKAAALAGTVVISLVGAVPAEAAAAWRLVVQPPLKPASRLVDVSATGPADAWAVGYQDNSYGRLPTQPAALMHWDGSAWTERLLPGEFDMPVAISATAPSDVWAVGQDENLVPYAAHWDGTAWRGQAEPGQGRFNDVAARTGRPLVVGSRRAGGALVMEWDGQRFTEVSVPGSDAWPGGSLLSVATVPGGAAFAVGEWNVDNAGYPEPMIVQRTGGGWQVAALPKVREARLTGVYARSATEAWAVGTIAYDTTRPKPLIMHWDGVSWQQVTAPIDAATLASVGGDAAGNLWVSGGHAVEPYGVSYPGSLFLRYQAKKWTVAHGPKVGANDPYLSAVENIPGTRAFWGVGTVYNPRTDQAALIERIG